VSSWDIDLGTETLGQTWLEESTQFVKIDSLLRWLSSNFQFCISNNLMLLAILCGACCPVLFYEANITELFRKFQIWPIRQHETGRKTTLQIAKKVLALGDGVGQR
jgi:hypothetical protein